MAGKPKPNEWSLATMPAELTTVAVGALGGLFFYSLRIPGGAISGSMIAVAILSATGRATPSGGILRVLALSTMGLAIGSAVGPDTFANLAAYPVSMVMMSVCVIAVTFASATVWHVLMRWPGPMALLASVPGSMSYIVSVSMSLGADAPKIAVVQMSRVIFLATILPFIVVYEAGGHYSPPELRIIDPMPMVLLTLVDFNWRLFGRICIGTTMAVGAAMLVSVCFAFAASKMFGVSFGTALIAYAPGGQDAMMVLALALGVDPIFVSAHHLARYFLINASLPFFITWLQRREESKQALAGGSE